VRLEQAMQKILDRALATMTIRRPQMHQLGRISRTPRKSFRYLGNGASRVRDTPRFFYFFKVFDWLPKNNRQFFDHTHKM